MPALFRFPPFPPARNEFLCPPPAFAGPIMPITLPSRLSAHPTRVRLLLSVSVGRAYLGRANNNFRSNKVL